MKKETVIGVLVQLGKLFRALGNEQPWDGFTTGLTEEEYVQLQRLIAKEQVLNPWFTKDSVAHALKSLGEMLQPEVLEPFAGKYEWAQQSRRVAIIMAGNIPLVGFHDVMCVLLSGHKALCKLSSSDARLLPAFAQIMYQWNPSLKDLLICSVGPLKDMDAVIATGSDNSANYFESYFGKYPHIFRKNRTSVAVLDGSETPEELTALGEDMFRYFGLGCRNVSKLLVPHDFNLDPVFEAIVPYGDIVNHHKYANNYDYNRTIYLMNNMPFLDNNFCLLREEEGLFSPLSVFFVQRYTDRTEADNFLAVNAGSIQTVVGHNYHSFGSAQTPAIDDFADGIDTMKWLEMLS